MLLPAWGVVVAADGGVMRLAMEEAACAAPDLLRMPHASRVGPGTALDLPGGVPRLDRAPLTMPFGARMNCGHFVLDALSSPAALDRTELFGAHPALVPPLTPWQARHFALMGPELRRAGFAAVDTGRMGVDRRTALFAGAGAVVGAASLARRVGLRLGWAG